MYSSEPMRPFNVRITFPDGNATVKSIYACTKWHAVELVYSKNCHLQPDRSQYQINNKTLRKRITNQIAQ